MISSCVSKTSAAGDQRAAAEALLRKLGAVDRLFEQTVHLLLDREKILQGVPVED